MTLDNLQYALYLNNRILLDRIKAVKDVVDGNVSDDIKELKKLLEELDTDLSNHTSDTVIHVTQNDKDLWNATLQNAKDYAKKLFDSVTSFTIEIVDALPTEDIKSMTIYFMRNGRDNESDYYEEYMYINDKWEIIGSTFVNLAPYLLKTDFEKYQQEIADKFAKYNTSEEISNTLSNYLLSQTFTNTLKNYSTTTEINKVLETYAKKTELHKHGNKNILDKLSDVSGTLNYNGTPIQTEIQISQESDNALEERTDGLYVPKSATLEEANNQIDEIKKQNALLQAEINSLNTIIDSINRAVI